METHRNYDRDKVNMNQRDATRYPFNITWPNDGDIPLIAYFPLPKNLLKYVHQFYNQYPDKVIAKVSEALKTVEECGCTTFIVGGTMEQMDASVRAVRVPEKGIDLKLNVILNPEYLNISPRTTLRILTHFGATKNLDSGEYSPFPNQERIVAWQVMDQPHFWDWGDTLALDGRPGTDYIWNRLTMGYGMTTSLDHYYKENENPSSSSRQRLSWFDLAPVPDKKPTSGQVLTDWLGSCSTYSEYLKVLDRLFRPKVWCYNFFPFMNTLDSNGNVTGVNFRLAEFFRYLTLFRDRLSSPYEPAIQPSFWNYTMASEQKYVDASGKTEWHRPSPTVGMVRLQVFGSLAFGAKGTIYYMYGAWYSDATSGAHSVYGEAPLACDISGSGVDDTITFRKSNIWKAIRTVNSEVTSWKSVFAKSKVIECLTKGVSVDGIEAMPDGYECLNSLGTGSKGVLVSHMVQDVPGSSTDCLHYLVIVSLDYGSNQVVRASFKTSYGARFLAPLQTIVPKTPEHVLPPVIIDPTTQRSLSPGGIAVISWTAKK